MLDNLTALAVAKVKALGLVAGTAMVTTALVGGGAVAVTVVSNEKAQQPPAGDAVVLETEQRSETATAVIKGKDKDKPGDDEDGEAKGCGAEVSAVATTKAADGRAHGEAVSEAARDCNGSLDEDGAPGKSAGKGKADERGKPASDETGTTGRPQEGPGSEEFVGQQGGRDAVTAEDDDEQETAETEEDGSGRPADAGKSAGKGGGRG